MPTTPHVSLNVAKQSFPVFATKLFRFSAITTIECKSVLRICKTPTIAICCHLLLFVVISCHWLVSGIMRCCLLLFLAIFVICCYLLLLVVICFYSVTLRYCTLILVCSNLFELCYSSLTDIKLHTITSQVVSKVFVRRNLTKSHRNSSQSTLKFW